MNGGRRHPVGRLLLSTVRRRHRDLIRLAGWSILEALPAFLSGRLVASAIDDGFLAGRPITGFAWLALLAVSFLVGAWATRNTYLRLAVVVEPFRDELVRLVVTGTLRRSTALGKPADTAGVARLTHQVELVREAYATLAMVVQGFLVTTTSALLGLLTLLPAVLILVLPPLLLSLALFLVTLLAMAAKQRALLLAEERIAEASSTLAGGLRDVVACGAEERVRRATAEHVDAQARVAHQLARLIAVRTVSIGVGGWLPLVLVLAAAPWLVRNGATTGAILGALTYVSQGLQPALETLVRGVGGTILWLVVTLGRIIETGEASAGSARAAAPGEPEPGHPCGPEVELRGVTFAYGTHAEPVIRDLDLVVPAGDHLAVVGPSGIGKSTLAGLISGMLQPQAGEVTIGGICAHALDIRLLAAHRVLIPQEAYVFAGTLRENLCYLRPDAATAELDAAVDTLGLLGMVRRLGGYDVALDASLLSAGERQLVALVRAYLSPARLVILDEATCHLDPTAELRVERAFLHRPGALVVIAHRMSSALRARRILAMDGPHTALGTHETLLAASQLYRDLVGHWLDSDSPSDKPAASHERRISVSE